LAYKGKNRDLFDDITVEEARWLADLLNQLTDKQIEDAFRAANYSPEDIKTLLLAVKARISDLNQATKQVQAGM
jgi:ribonuclease I